MAILDQAKASWAARPQHRLEIPEWGSEGAPLVVFFKTPNAATLAKVAKESRGDEVEQMARLVAMVLTDEAGTRLFAPLDYKDLMTSVDPAVLARVAAAVMVEARFDVAQAEKN